MDSFPCYCRTIAILNNPILLFNKPNYNNIVRTTKNDYFLDEKELHKTLQNCGVMDAL